MRGGDSLVAPFMKAMPNITVGKVLIQRDEHTKEKLPVFTY